MYSQRWISNDTWHQVDYEVNQAFDFAAFLSLFAFLLFDVFSIHKTVWCHAVLSLMDFNGYDIYFFYLNGSLKQVLVTWWNFPTTVF